ncbi:hypothetical protein [Cellulomonas bogoriensis]|uniref:Uncharacterized protein n=1 Tax=Cellulomonas bogoriensis 69B4 = DSM 16987 TaxID=1386082 RepID=A0A0A0BVR5_9CELL|nr:hypothetical protein [Cellulomonas bogoriensis]KGM12036.1 hypothetical protein N869_02215 [Cellulomonas bogoriensis 69B4 = DSM 16987]
MAAGTSTNHEEVLAAAERLRQLLEDIAEQREYLATIRLQQGEGKWSAQEMCADFARHYARKTHELEQRLTEASAQVMQAAEDLRQSSQNLLAADDRANEILTSILQGTPPAPTVVVVPEAYAVPADEMSEYEYDPEQHEADQTPGAGDGATTPAASTTREPLGVNAYADEPGRSS